MRIFNKVKPDKDGRVTLSKEILKTFTDVVMFIEDDTEMIRIADVRDFPYGAICKIDQHDRITIPAWLRQEIGDSELFVIEDDGKFYFSVKTGKIL